MCCSKQRLLGCRCRWMSDSNPDTRDRGRVSRLLAVVKKPVKVQSGPHAGWARKTGEEIFQKRRHLLPRRSMGSLHCLDYSDRPLSRPTWNLPVGSQRAYVVKCSSHREDRLCSRCKVPNGQKSGGLYHPGVQCFSRPAI